MSTTLSLLRPAEIAVATAVPLRQVNRIIDAGLLGRAVHRRDGTRLVDTPALVGLKLAHETAGVLSRASRRKLVAAVLRDPQRETFRADPVVVEVRPVAREVRAGLARLAKARRLVTASAAVLGGTPVFRGTRIPVHDIAAMLANGDAADAIARAYPALDEERIRLAAVYAAAYPARGRPRGRPAWQARKPRSSEVVRLDVGSGG